MAWLLPRAPRRAPRRSPPPRRRATLWWAVRHPTPSDPRPDAYVVRAAWTDGSIYEWQPPPDTPPPPAQTDAPDIGWWLNAYCVQVPGVYYRRL